jgi:predicted transcriptional regulator
MQANKPPPENSVPTSIKLPAALKAKIDNTARKAGISAHAFMVKTLGEATERAGQRDQFTQDAQSALDEVRETGMAYRFDDVRAYFAARARGENPPRPKLKRWRGEAR